MKLVGKLSVSQTLNGIQSVGGKGGGASDWEHLKDKPFETLGDDFTVDNGELQLAEDYATEDYVDSAVAAITPTIPAVSATSTLSSGTEIGSITIDGVTTTYYAPQGGSVNIDNKSLIEVDGVIQEAVPIYSEGGSVAITLNSAPGAYMDVYTKTFGGEYGEYIYNNGVVSGANYKVYFRVNYFDAEHIEIIDTFDTYGYINNLNVEQYMQSYIGYGDFTENSPCKQFNFNSFSLRSQLYGDVQTYGKVRLNYDMDSNEARRYELVCLSIEELQDSQFDETNETYHIGSSIIYHKLPNEYLNIDNETIINDNDVLKAVSGDVDWSDIANKPTFATVATSGDYDDLSNKPTIPVVPSDVSAFNNDAGYITSTALTPYVEASSLAAVATSGDYDDLSNKPVIPAATSVTVTQTLSTGTAIADIDVDGVTTTLYAPAGGSVDIDNKSIIKNQDDELQTAVPVYSETIEVPLPATGLVITDFVPNGTIDADFYVDTNANTLTLLPPANVYDNYEFYLIGSAATLKCGWKASTSGTMDGAKILESTNTAAYPINRTFQFYYSYTTSHFPSGSGGYKFHIYNLGGNYSVWDTLILYPTATGIANGDTLESQCETLGLNWTGTQTQTIYHKLPMDYVDLNIVTNETLYSGFYPMLYKDNFGNIRADRLAPGSNMSIAQNTLADGTKGYTLACSLKESPIGGYYNNSGGSYNCYFNTKNVDTTHRRHYTSQYYWNNLFNWAGATHKDLYFTLQYCLSASSYYSGGPKITGVLHLGATNTDTPTVEGFEGIIERVFIDTSNTNEYFCIDYCENIGAGLTMSIIFYYGVQWFPAKQNVNAFFLPLDKETIVVDTNGNIKTAIPAAPTTAGTYSLQVVVDASGNPTYSWI